MARTVSILISIAAVVLVSSTTFAADKGTLCFVAPKEKPVCTATEADSAKTTTAAAERAFVWSSADGKRLLFGRVAANATSVDLLERAFAPVTLSVRGDQRHGWPEELRLVVTGADKKTWSWSVAAKSVGALAQIALPSGKYTIQFAADHHLTETRRLDLPLNKSLREIALRPMPVVSGRVMTAKDAPVADAQIVREDHKVIATTDEQGNFRGEALEPLPDSLLIEKSGLGSRFLSPHFSTGDADLGVIRLGAAVRLVLHIIRPDGNHDTLHVRLSRHGEKYDYIPVASKDLSGADVAFEDLSKGEYAVIIEGSGPLEKMVSGASVGEADLEKEIRIEPYHLDGTAHLGDDPMNGTLKVTMGGVHLEWSMPIADGRFGATLWQHGDLHGWLKTEGDPGSVEPVGSPPLGADPSTWNIRLPKRFITGRVFDVDDGQAMKGAGLALLRTSAGTRLYTAIHLSDDGTFSIMATKSGTYELTASAPDHVNMKQTVEIREEDASVQRDFALTHGLAATLEAIWPSGSPVVNANVLEGVASDGHNAERQYTLDAAGRLSLRMTRGESRTLFIVPAEGSLAIAHIAAQEGSESAPVRVVVPEPAGSLDVKISTADGKRARARLGLRFNGEVVPTPVLLEIGFRAHPAMLDERSLLLMPAGAYELWPVSPQTYAPIGSPKSATVLAGVTSVELTVSQQ